MRTEQLQRALRIARTTETPLDYANLLPFDGFGRSEFCPITCTLDALAALIRWQCVNFDGSIDSAALQEIADVGRHHFTVLE